MLPLTASCSRPIELWLLPSGIRGDGDQDQVSVIGRRADVQGVGALQVTVDEFPVLPGIVTAIGAPGSGHVHRLRSRHTQAETVNVIVRARQLLPAGAAIAGADHASHLNSSIQTAWIVRSHAQVAHVSMPGLGVKKPLLRLWYGPKADVFFPALAAIMGAKDGGWFAANVYRLGVLGMHQDAVCIVRRIRRQMSPGQTSVISAIHPCLIRCEIGTLRYRRAAAEAGCGVGQQRDLALLPRLAGVGAGQGTHPVVHAYIEFALVMMCLLHSSYL